MKHLLIVSLLISITSGLSAQERGRNIFTADFDHFIEKLEQIHPDPYSSYGGRVDFMRKKQELREEVKQLVDTAAFVSKVNSFLSQLHDGHTYINRTVTGGNIKSRLLPLDLWVAMDGVFIRDVDPRYGSLKGGIVTAVDGTPVETLLDRMETLVAAENRYDNYRTFANYIISDHYAAQLLGYQPDSLTVTVDLGAGQSAEATLPFRDEKLSPTAKGLFDDERPNGILFTRLLPEAGYLCWNSILSRELIETNMQAGYDIHFLIRWAFMYLDGEPTGDLTADIERVPYLYRSLAALLEEMDRAGTRDLIIDLRHNRGGMTPLTYSVVRMLYGDSFLERKLDAVYGVRLSAPLLAKRGYENIAAYNAAKGTDYLEGDMSFGRFADHGYNTVTEIVTDPMYRAYHTLEKGWFDTPANRDRRLNVYVLVSPLTFSAAYHFTYMLSEMGATLVGVPPGQAGNTFMEQTLVTLPGTGITGSVSNSWQEFYPGDPGRGTVLTPEYPMDVRDFSRYGYSRDAELLHALDIILKRP